MAVVTASPRSMIFEVGDGRPFQARGPDENIGWHESGRPIGCIRLAASNSRMPGLVPKHDALDRLGSMAGGEFEPGEFVDFERRAQAVFRIHQQGPGIGRRCAEIARSVSAMKDGISSQTAGSAVSSVPVVFPAGRTDLHAARKPARASSSASGSVAERSCPISPNGG